MSAEVRNPSQARGTARRQALLEAAIRLLARDGARAVTHRAVAEEAGATHGSTRYYFATRELLLDAALRGIAEREVAAVKEQLRAPGPIDPGDRVARLSSFLVSKLDADRDSAMARYELFLEAARRPALRDALKHWGDAYRSLIASELTAGASDPEVEAEVLLNLLNGLLLQQLATPIDDFEVLVLRPAIERFIDGPAS